MLLCDSLGVSSTDLKMFDDVIAKKVKEKAPEGFNLLKIAQERAPPISNNKFPTLLHLGATHGLPSTVALCLQYCPAAHQACLLKNVDGNTPIEIARKLGRHEIAKCLQNFQSNKWTVTNNNDQREDGVQDDNGDNEDIYMEMRPNMTPEDKSDGEYDYVRMPGIGTNRNRIRMTPELQSAVSVAENAVRISWIKGELQEATLNAFRQLIENSITENADNSTYSLPRDLGPALPPKSNHLNYKRHSIHDIPNSAPPLPPRSPRSAKSPLFFLGDQAERRGSDPSIFHRMQPHFTDKLTISEENGTIHQPSADQPPQLPAKTRSPLSATRGLRSLTNEWSGSDPNLSHRSQAYSDLNSPPKPTQGVQRRFPDGFLRPKSSSIDATSLGLSPRLPPRIPKRHTRSASCEPDSPEQNIERNRTFSEPR
ncbi:Phosphoinositide 3-kinase adapter protein 1 [Stylophora pistillata]|uniref:Phosphoinositide 3-kinase adapter protein 1 n=2 Tax=Stylophora pistillata TaxID=50429 RepID=A0A2B4RIL5_STYPI|nr:Phosphoinositide 3-kinase adapter protein 1 [Stylophora pistillata]